jgi:hypothetical protein
MTMTTLTSHATQLLFTLDLQYDPSRSQRSSADGKPGHYIGSGTGRAEGDRVSGAARWDLYEDQAPTRCNASFAGTIETEKGAIISFTTTGYLYLPDNSAPHAWRTDSKVTLKSDAAEYAWLNGVEAAWSGSFDMSTYRHSYRILLENS